MKTSIYEGGEGAPNVVVPRDPTPSEIPELMQYAAAQVLTDEQVEDLISEPGGFLEAVMLEEKMNQLSSTGVWAWDLYQLQYFQTISSFICNKCRQSGGSAMLSAKGFVKGVLARNNYTMILTSYKKEEAINKIDYVRQYLSALPPTFRKKIVRDPRQLIEFENANGTRVKILSHAQKPIRGINGDVGLDELAFYQWAEEVYSSAGPATAMSRSSIDIISTPFGKSGIFYEIYSDEHKFSEYRRMSIMWWFCLRYLKDPTMSFFIEAYNNAPGMSTEERVMRYGNSFLRSQYKKAVDEETFQQEFEGLFVDAQAAFFTKDEIINSMFGKATSIDDYDPVDSDVNEDSSIEEAFEDRASLIQTYYNSHFDGVDKFGDKIVFHRYNSMLELAEAVSKGKVSRNLYAGLDIGMTRHSSHFVVFEEIHLSDGSTLMIERFGENFHEPDMDIQEAKYISYLKLGIIRKMHGDGSGLGRGICERLAKRFRGVFKVFIFTNSSKEELYINFKHRLTQMRIAMAYDKLTIESIYSVDRVITATGTVSFKADERKRHHGDAADAIALAIWGGRRYGETASSILTDQELGKKVRTNIQEQTAHERMAKILSKKRGGASGLRSRINPGKFIKNHDL